VRGHVVGALLFAVAAVILATATMLLLRTSTDPVVATGHDGTELSRVDLEFRTLHGDTGRPAANTEVTVAVDTWQGCETQTVTTDDQGLVTIRGIDPEATVTAFAAAPGGSVTFPVEVDLADEGAPRGTVDLPLYEKDDQWPSWGRSCDRSRCGPAIGLPDGGPLWMHDTGYNVEFPPTLAYGMVFYGSYSGRVYAHRQSDGEMLWKHLPGKQRRNSKFANQVAVSSWMEGCGEKKHRVARVFYANIDGVAGAIDAFTGEHVWRRVSGRGPGTDGRNLLFRSFESSPLIVGETLYLASRYHHSDSEAGLWAFDRRTGAVRWFCKLGASDASKIGGSPSYADGRVYIGCYDGGVFAVDARTGSIVWSTRLRGQFYSTPAIDGEQLYIGSKSNGRVYCLRTSDGSVVWYARGLRSVYGSPALWGHALYIGGEREFVAMSRVDGSVLWRYPTAGKVLGSATVLDDVVYFSDLSGHTYACDARNGELVWEWEAGRYSPVTATRHLIMVTGRHRIWAFRPST